MITMSKVKILTRSVLFLSCALLLSAAPVVAFVPHDDHNEFYEVRLPVIDPHAGPEAAAQAAIGAAEAALQTRHGGAWRVLDWNSQTDTPRWVYGPPMRRAAAITGKAQLEQLAMQVVSENRDVLGAEPDDLRLAHAPRALGKWVAHLQQYWHGHEVWEGKVRLVFHENGNLMVMGSNFHRNIDLDPRPNLKPGAAADAALRDLWFQPELGDSYRVEPDLLVLPVPLSETAVRHHLVYRVRVRTAEPPGDWVTHVDAHTGEIVWRYNDVHNLFEGGATNVVQPESYCNDPQVDPAAYLNLTVSGVGTTTTDANGEWFLSGGGSSATVSAFLRGPYVWVYNYNGSDASFSGTAQSGEPFTIDWTGANSRQDERDVFDAINRIHTFFQEFDPDFYYINQPLNAYVNRTDNYCPGNAWYNPGDNTIHFCAQGSGYANTGEIQGVVQHEYGHGIQDALMGGWQGDQGLGEGNSDIMANLITQESIIGRGFFLDNCGSGIRNSLNTLQYPGDVIGQPIHSAGRVIAGFHWDAMVLLQDQYGLDDGTVTAAERWHFARLLLQPSTQPDQVVATFIADDDNGDLSDGTPHHAIYSVAASNHGFDDFIPEIMVGMFVYHDPLPYQTNTMAPYVVTASGESIGAGEVDPSSFEIRYRIDEGDWQIAPMIAERDAFTGHIPQQPWGSVVRYYVSARNIDDDEGTSPRGAPGALHFFKVDNSFDEDMETETAWIGGLPTDTASSGQWERGVPQQTSYSGNTVQLGWQVTADGQYCWVTEAAAGSGAGTFDVDNGNTTLLSPVFDLGGGSDIHISYWRYYTNEHGANPGIDFWSVDISNDGGQTWSSVEYTDQSDSDWVQISFPLSDYFAEPGLVRMRFIADDPAPTGSLIEAMVDDFLLFGDFPSATSVGDTPLPMASFDLAQNHPNPFNPSTQLRFSLQRSGRASLKVFDMRGRLVKTLISGHVPAGEHTITWNGQDELGRPASSGVYLYRLESSGQTIERRMLLVK
jgi:hypothetical protein